MKLESLDMEKELKSAEDQITSLKDKIYDVVKQLEKLNETADSAKVFS